LGLVCSVGRSQWPRVLRRASAAAHFAGIAGSNVGGRMAVCRVNVVCCQVEVSASGRSLVQRSPTECGMSEWVHKASTMRRPWTTRGCCPIKFCSSC
jgi:hypothetical protein